MQQGDIHTCWAAEAFVFVFPDAEEHLHPAEKGGEPEPWPLKRLFDPSGTGFVVAQCEQHP